MPLIFIAFGFRFSFYSNEHEPTHVHAKKGNGAAIFQVHPEVQLLSSYGLKPADLKIAERLVKENQSFLMEKWNEFFKK